MAYIPYHGRDTAKEAEDRAQATNDFVTGNNPVTPMTSHGRDESKFAPSNVAGSVPYQTEAERQEGVDESARIAREKYAKNPASEEEMLRLEKDTLAKRNESARAIDEADASFASIQWDKARMSDKTPEEVAVIEDKYRHTEQSKKNDAAFYEWMKATDRERIAEESREQKTVEPVEKEPPPEPKPVDQPKPVEKPPVPEPPPAQPARPIDDSDRPRKPTPGISEDRRIDNRIEDVEDDVSALGASADKQKTKDLGRHSVGDGGLDTDYCYVGVKKLTIPTKTSDFLKIYLDGITTPEWVAAMPTGDQDVDSIVIDVTKNRIYLNGETAG